MLPDIPRQETGNYPPDQLYSVEFEFRDHRLAQLAKRVGCGRLDEDAARTWGMHAQDITDEGDDIDVVRISVGVIHRSGTVGDAEVYGTATLALYDWLFENGLVGISPSDVRYKTWLSSGSPDPIGEDISTEVQQLVSMIPTD